MMLPAGFGKLGRSESRWPEPADQPFLRPPREDRPAPTRRRSLRNCQQVAESGSLRCLVTDDPARFKRLAPRFLGIEIDTPDWVSPDDLFGKVARHLPISVPA